MKMSNTTKTTGLCVMDLLYPKKPDLAVAIEDEDTSGRVSSELEHTFYALIEDFTQLKNARSKIHQEQWEIKVEKTDKNASKGSLRVRKVIEPHTSPLYVFTIKTPLISNTGIQSKAESSVVTTVDQFVQFKLMSEKGMIKDRYEFPIEGTDLKWEIDLFIKEPGVYHPWCKIDLEVKDPTQPIPDWPMGFKEVLNGADPANGNRITELYTQYFLATNKGADAIEAEQAEILPASDLPPVINESSITEGDQVLPIDEDEAVDVVAEPAL